MSKPKKVCPNCKKVKRTNCFVYNRVQKREICKMCNKKIGNNIFYVPFAKQKDYISRYNITEEEKKRLLKKYGNWKDVWNHIKMLKNQKRETKDQVKSRKRYFAMRKKEKAEQQKKFLEGLK